MRLLFISLILKRVFLKFIDKDTNKKRLKNIFVISIYRRPIVVTLSHTFRDKKNDHLLFFFVLFMQNSLSIL